MSRWRATRSRHVPRTSIYTTAMKTHTNSEEDFENAIVPRRYPQDEIGNAHDFHPLSKDSLKSGFPQGRRDLFSSKLLITLHKPDLMCLKLFFIFISERSEISRDHIAQMLSSSAVDKYINSLCNNRIMCM